MQSRKTQVYPTEREEDFSPAPSTPHPQEEPIQTEPDYTPDYTSRTRRKLPAHLLIQMSQIPVYITCRYCQHVGFTEARRRHGPRGVSAITCMVCCGCCCFLIPLWENLKDTTHYCKNCRKKLGKFIGKYIRTNYHNTELTFKSSANNV